MWLPDLGRLSLRACPTGADSSNGGEGPSKPPRRPQTRERTRATRAAREAVLSTDELVALIMANIRDGDVATVCQAVDAWYARVCDRFSEACAGTGGNANADLWRRLCDRVFPNYRQEVWPPVVWQNGELQPASEAMDEMLTSISFGLSVYGITQRRLPWSGHEQAYSWRDWFYLLCNAYFRMRGEQRDFIDAKRERRRASRREVHRLTNELEQLRAKESPPREPDADAPPNLKSKAIESKENALGRMEEFRKWDNWKLEKAMDALDAFEKQYGRTRDHKDFDPTTLRKKYEPAGEDEDGSDADEDPDSESDPDDVSHYDTDDERALAKKWGWDYSDDEDPPGPRPGRLFYEPFATDDEQELDPEEEEEELGEDAGAGPYG